METIKIVIPGELMDLNKFINHNRSNRFSGNKAKRDETERVAWEVKRTYRDMITKYPVHIEYNWYSKDNRIDIDNVAFAKKFVNDGLVEGGLLQNDSRKFISGFSDFFYIDKENPRVEIFIKT